MAKAVDSADERYRSRRTARNFGMMSQGRTIRLAVLVMCAAFWVAVAAYVLL